ncbi:hypothetical protein HY990_04050 [Candidatus Micrarchaeota archaeon]|nr:hypothetical protein [Candidatus Micrarchaeota archaeon]
MAGGWSGSILITIILSLMSFGGIYWFNTLFDDRIKHILKILIFTGSFGGLIFGFFEREKHYELCQYNGSFKINFGSLADMLTGIGAAYAVFFALAGSLKIDIFDESNLAVKTENTLRLIGLGVLSGLGGKALLFRLQTGLIKQIGELGQKVKKVKESGEKIYWYNIGELYRLQGKFENSEYAYGNAIELDGKYHSARIGLALTLAGKSKQAVSDKERLSLLHQALDICDAAIKEKPDFAPFYLARAAVHCISEPVSGDVKTDLEKVISIDPMMKKFIKEEDEFKVLNDLQWFKEIIK